MAASPPSAGRGYFGVSRAVDYGVLNSVTEMQQSLNRELCLMAQIETTEAMKNLDQLAAVPGVDLFVGPADLAASLGYPGQTLHPSVREAATRIIQAARANNKCIASACGPSDFKFWLDQKIDLLFCTNDIACLKRGAALALEEARALLSTAPQARIQQRKQPPPQRDGCCHNADSIVTRSPMENAC